MTLPGWARYGSVAGLIAFVITLVANLLILFLSPAQLCGMGPLIIPIGMLAAFLIYLLIAAATGFVTARFGGTTTETTLAGVLLGAIAGCAIIAVALSSAALMHRTEQLSALCPNAGGSIFIGSTPPPGVPTPPPNAFANPPPGPFPGSPGQLGLLFVLVGAAFSAGVGMAVAAGVSTLGGLVGRSTGRAR